MSDIAVIECSIYIGSSYFFVRKSEMKKNNSGFTVKQKPAIHIFTLPEKNVSLRF